MCAHTLTILIITFTQTHIYVFGLIRFAWLSRRLPSYVTLSITDRALGLYLRQRRTTTRAWACVCVCVCVTHCHLVSELQKCARVHALPWLRIVPIPALQCILTMSGCPHTCVCVCVWGSAPRSGPPPGGGGLEVGSIGRSERSSPQFDNVARTRTCVCRVQTSTPRIFMACAIRSRAACFARARLLLVVPFRQFL